MFATSLTPPFRRARAYAAPPGMPFRRQARPEQSPDLSPGNAVFVLRGWRPREIESRASRRGRFNDWATVFFDLLPFWRMW